MLSLVATLPLNFNPAPNTFTSHIGSYNFSKIHYIYIYIYMSISDLPSLPSFFLSLSFSFSQDKSAFLASLFFPLLKKEDLFKLSSPKKEEAP